MLPGCMNIEFYKGKYHAVLIFGAPGSGKGTLARFLSGCKTLFHLSSGEVFRGLAATSEAGKLFRRYADRGELIPDRETVALWNHYMQGLVATNRFIPEEQWLLLDGIPRTRAQVDLIKAHVEVHAVLVLDVKNPSELIARMVKRAKEEKRIDDAEPEVIQRRLEVFNQETLSVLEGFPASIVHHINGELPPIEVAKEALVALSSLLSRAPLCLSKPCA